MKLAYISETTIPSRSASVVHVLKMCEAFGKLGHEVTMFYVSVGKPDMREICGSYGVDHRFNAVGLEKAARRTFLYEYGLRVGWMVRKARPELAVCRNLPGCLACAALGIPVVYEAHMPTSSRGAASDHLFRLLLKLRHLRGIVVISRALKEYFEANYRINDKRIVVLPDAA